MEELSEHVVITIANAKLLGGIIIVIHSKKTAYEEQLDELEELPQNRKQLHIRNQTNLLSTKSALGYKYLDGYIASTATIGRSFGDNDLSNIRKRYQV